MTLVMLAIPEPELDAQWVTDLELPEGEQARLELLQALLGGYLELVRTVVPGLWLFCNEDGSALGLPPNLLASSLCGQRVLGPVIFHGGADSRGELVGIADRDRAIMLSFSI